MNIWLCPVKLKNWRIIKRVKVFGVPRHAYKTFSQVKKGDLFVFHVLKPVNGVVAVGKVISQIFEDYENIWGRERYPLRVKIEILDEYTRSEREPVPLSKLMGALETTEIEITLYLRNVWIAKLTEQQYQTLIKYLSEKSTNN